MFGGVLGPLMLEWSIITGNASIVVSFALTRHLVRSDKFMLFECGYESCRGVLVVLRGCRSGRDSGGPQLNAPRTDLGSGERHRTRTVRRV